MESDEYVDALLALQEENLSLRQQICALEHLLANGSPIVDGESVKDDILATVIFHETPAAKRKKIESFISSLFESVNDSEIDIDDDNDSSDDEETYQSSCLTMYGRKCNDYTDCSCQSRTLKLTGAVEYHHHYMLDWLGTPMITRGDSYTLPDELRIPYEQVYFQPFWAPGSEDKEENFKLRKIVLKCFNCGDSHHMKVCPKPFNPFAVARSKIQFQEETGAFGSSDKRYYIELESQERFNNFQPGKISDKLRIALSLSDGDLPLYIIRMKEFGYPPGWKLLKEESLKIFDGKEEEIASTVPCEDIVYPGYNDKLLIKPDESSTIVVTNSKEDDDLQELGDYEFDMEDEGGFVLRKLIKEEETGFEESDKESFNKVKRSLDFPPGLVEIDNPTPAKGRWTELIKIVEKEKRKISTLK